jgi:Fic family protein
MTLLLLSLFVGTLIFLVYYEFIWKKVEQARGKNLVSMARDFFAESYKLSSDEKSSTLASVAGTNWGDWKYRLLVELHRRQRISAKEASGIVEVPEDRVEKYLDSLESEGKIQQIGDAKRGLFYKIVNES